MGKLALFSKQLDFLAVVFPKMARTFAISTSNWRNIGGGYFRYLFKEESTSNIDQQTVPLSRIEIVSSFH